MRDGRNSKHCTIPITVLHLSLNELHSKKEIIRMNSLTNQRKPMKDL